MISRGKENVAGLLPLLRWCRILGMVGIYEKRNINIRNWLYVNDF